MCISFLPVSVRSQGTRLGGMARGLNCVLYNYLNTSLFFFYQGDNNFRNKRSLNVKTVDKPFVDRRLQFHIELSSIQRKDKNMISQIFLGVHLIKPDHPQGRQLGSAVCLFVCLFKGHPGGYRSSQARGRMGATAVSLHQSQPYKI